jgi:hydrogenase nickel incorporation protein HypA/HybF
VHELSICQALLNTVERIVRAQGARAAARVTVRLGALSGVVPALLEQAFFHARAGRPAVAEAELMIEHAPLRVFCTVCGAETEAVANRLLCARCGDWRTRLVSGDELLLVSVELVKSSSAAAPAARPPAFPTPPQGR